MGVKHLFWTLALQVFPLSLPLMPLSGGGKRGQDYYYLLGFPRRPQTSAALQLKSFKKLLGLSAGKISGCYFLIHLSENPIN